MELLRLPAAVLAIAFIFQACQKDKNATATDSGGSRLQKVTKLSKAEDATRSRSFYRDTLNRIVRVLDSMTFNTDNNSLASWDNPMSIEYDAQGRVGIITSRLILLNDAIYNLWQYDANGTPKRRIYIDELARDTITHIYTYDNQNRLLIDSLFNHKNKKLIDYTIYTYDSHDNVVEWNRYTNASGAIKNELKVQAVYDHQPNPYRTVGSSVFSY
jgi:hypothetical protein